MDVNNIFAEDESNANIGTWEEISSSPNNFRKVESSQTQRRACNYLQVLARALPSLSTIIHSHPYDMPIALFTKLKACHDIQSAVRRSGGGIHFDS